MNSYQTTQEAGIIAYKGCHYEKYNLRWDGCPYLVDIGFITELNDGDNLKDQLKDVTITSLGKDLIDAENAERKRRGETEITGRLKLSAGIIEAEIEGKHKV